MSSFQTLLLTDGATTVDLLFGPYFVSEWIPAIVNLQGGGVYQESPLADHRQLIYAKWGNATETFRLSLRAGKQRDAARKLQDLRRLLQQARNFWLKRSWQNDPVWLEVRNAGDDAARYALVYAWQTPTDGTDPFRNPFVGAPDGSIIPEFLVSIERGHWLSRPPGQSDAVPVGYTEEYNSVAFGNITGDVTDGTAPIANKRNIAQLTHIYRKDGAGIPPLWSANLIGTTTNYVWATGTSNSAVYFGVQTSLTDSGPFCSLVLTNTAGMGAHTYAWEYWNGSTWGALTIYDPSDGLQNSGEFAIVWKQPSNWAAGNLQTLSGDPSAQAVTAFWIRLRFTSITGTPSKPNDGKRPYSIVWPFIEVDAEQIGGDIEALGRIQLFNEGDEAAHTGSDTNLYANRAFVGARSTERGENYSAYLNCSDEQNPANAAGSVLVDTTLVDNSLGATGRVARWSPTTTTDSFLFQWVLNDLITGEYKGVFRTFARVYQSAGSLGTVRIGAAWEEADGQINYTPTKAPGALNTLQLLDLGLIEVQAQEYGSEKLYQLSFYLYGESTVTSGVTLDLYDLILLPADEWFGEFTDRSLRSVDAGATNGRYLDLDSTTDLRRTVRSNVRRTADGYRAANAWTPAGADPVHLRENKKQRLWCLFSRYATVGSSTDERADIEQVYGVKLFANQRYFSLRGVR